MAASLKKGFIAVIILFIFGISSAPASAADIPPCDYVDRWIRGDANGDGYHDVADPTFLIQLLFFAGPEPYCLEQADFNDDTFIDIADAIGLIAWLFYGGDGPAGAQDWSEVDETPDTDILYVNVPFEEAGVDADAIPEVTTKIRTMFRVTSQRGKVRGCQVTAYPVDANDEADLNSPVEIITTEWATEHEGFIGNPLTTDHFEFEIDPSHTQAGLDLGKHLFKVTCEGMDGQADSEYMYVNLVSQMPEETVEEDPLAGDNWREADDPSLCEAPGQNEVFCPEHDSICCRWILDDTISPLCLRVNATYPTVDLLRCDDPDDPLDDWYVQEDNSFCNPLPADACLLEAGHKCCINDDKKLACIKGEDGGPPEMTCADVADVTAEHALGAGGGAVDYSETPEEDDFCQIADVEILRRLDDWFKIPLGYKVREKYYLAGEIPAVNQKMLVSFVSGGYPGNATGVKLKGARDQNHNNNKLLGPHEGWLYNTFLGFGGRDPNTNRTSLDSKNGYESGLGFLVVARLKWGSDPAKCLEAQFVQSTIQFQHQGKTANTSLFVGNNPPNAPAPQGDVISYMYSTGELKTEKGLQQLRDMGKLPKDRNKVEKLQTLLSYTGTSAGSSLCTYDGENWCLDGYLAEHSLDAPERPGSSRDHKKYIQQADGKSFRFAKDWLIIPRTLPKIVWWDSPGGSAAVASMVKSTGTGLTIVEPMPKDQRGFTDWRGSFVMIIEEPQARIVEVVENEGTTAEETVEAQEWWRWVCELNDLHHENAFNASTKKRVKTHEDKIDCKCYPQKRSTPAESWERARGANGELIENLCN